MISDEAVIAAAKVLYADEISNHAGDNAPQIIDACEKVARKVLEAAAPHMLREAKAEGWDAALDAASAAYMDPSSADWMKETNPYRSQA